MSKSKRWRYRRARFVARKAKRGAWYLAEIDRIVRREIADHGMADRISGAIFGRSPLLERLAGKYEIGVDRAAGPDETATLVYSPKTYREWAALEAWTGEDE